MAGGPLKQTRSCVPVLALLGAACSAGIPTSPPPPEDWQWTAPTQLFSTELRLAAGTSLHAVGLEGSALVHRRSNDEGATWTASRPIPVTGSLPIYGPLAADGDRVHLLTHSAGRLRVLTSPDGGESWPTQVELAGYDANLSMRVQITAENGIVHVFLGRPGASGDASFRIYYWRSTNSGQSFGPVVTMGEDATAPASPGGIAVSGGTVHIGYAAITPIGTLGHRARTLRSGNQGASWTGPLDVSGLGDNPQIRPRPRALLNRVIMLWEEPLDHDRTRPIPNATRAAIRLARSQDGGLTWAAPQEVYTSSTEYPNHPEVAAGTGTDLHVVYRLSRDQATLSTQDRIGYRMSFDFGATWEQAEIALSDPGRDSQPVNLVATATHVHLAASNGIYVRRRFR